MMLTRESDQLNLCQVFIVYMRGCVLWCRFRPILVLNCLLQIQQVISEDDESDDDPGHEKTYLRSYANNIGADQSAHPRISVAVQAGLCLAWSEIPENTFCRVMAHLLSDCLHIWFSFALFALLINLSDSLGFILVRFLSDKATSLCMFLCSMSLGLWFVLKWLSLFGMALVYCPVLTCI